MTPGGSDPTLQLQIIINGIEDVKEQLAGVQKKGEEAAAKVDDAFQKSSQTLMQLSEKAGRFGSIWTQNVTMPIIALGTAAVAMSMDVLKGSESVRELTEEWKDLKSDVATAIVPTINALITDTLIPLVNVLGDLAQAWGRQSAEAKNAQIAMLGITAAVGPVVKGVSEIAIALGSLTYVFHTLKISATAAWSAVWPLAVLAGSAGLNNYLNPPGETGYNANIPSFGAQPGFGDYLNKQRGTTPGISWGHAGAPGATVPIIPPAPSFGGGGGGITQTPFDISGAAQGDYGMWGQDRWTLGGGPSYTGEGILRPGPTFAGLGFSSSLDSQMGIGPAPKRGLSQKMRDQIARNKGGGDGGQWYDSLTSNDFLMNAGMTLGGMAIGGASGRDMLGAALPLIGSAFGPVGAAVGGLLGMLVGKKKDRGDTPQNPVHVKVINPGDLGTAMLNAVKSLVTQLGAAGMNDLVKQVRMQGQLKGYS